MRFCCRTGELGTTSSRACNFHRSQMRGKKKPSPELPQALKMLLKKKIKKKMDRSKL